MDLSKRKYHINGLEDSEKHSLKFFKAMKRKRDNKWGWYRFRCWQYILNRYMESQSDRSPKGMYMLN